MPLESALLLLLSSGVLDSQETRARVSASVTLAGAGVLGTGAAAVATGLTVAQPAAVALVFALSVVSSLTVLRPLLRESSAEELGEQFAADARELLQGRADGAGSDSSDSSSPLALFYRSSALASVVVGGAFMLSPVSPLAVYEAELPVTYLARADFGALIALLLSPVQFELYRAAKAGALAARVPRLLNLLCAASIALLDGCGNAQVRMQEVLVAGMDGLPDTFRFEANTTAAFYTALLVGLVYLVQGVGAKQEAA